MIQLFATTYDTFLVSENLGIARIKKYFESQNEIVEVTYFDITKEVKCQLNKVKKGCNIYGFSMYYYNFDFFIQVIDEVRKMQADSILVVGSKFVTMYYKDILEKYDNINYAILGDGEYAFLHLINSLDSKEKILQHESIVSKDTVCDRNKKPAVININDLPWPDRTWTVENNHLFAFIHDSQGCAGRCSFCTQGNYYPEWNGRSAEDIYNEIISINQLAKVNHFIFTGGSFEDPGKQGKDKIRKLCSLIKQNNNKFTFQCYMRADSFANIESDKELLKLMKSAGFNLVFIGIESGNDEDLRVYNKRATAENNKIALSLFKEAGIYTGRFGFVMFNPYSTKERLTENYRFLVNIKAAFLSTYITGLRIDKTTKIFERVNKDGLLTFENKLQDMGGITYKFSDSSIEEIYGFVTKYFLDNRKIARMCYVSRDCVDFVYGFYEFIDNGLQYKEELTNILEENAAFLKEYFYHLYEEFDLQTCKDQFSEIITKYRNNTSLLIRLQNKVLKHYIRESLKQ